VALPVALIGAAASGLIYHRISMSFSQANFAPDTGRVKLLIAGVRMIRSHPFFGVGPQRIHTEFPRYYLGLDLPEYYGHLENNVVQLAAERGVLCLAAFLWFVFELYASLISIVRKAADEARWPAVSALAALTGFLVAGVFEYNFGDSEILMLLLFIVSVPFGTLRNETSDVDLAGAGFSLSRAPREARARQGEVSVKMPTFSQNALRGTRPAKAGPLQ
jgi:O-antigen ligase